MALGRSCSSGTLCDVEVSIYNITYIIEVLLRYFYSVVFGATFFAAFFCILVKICILFLANILSASSID